MLFEARTPLGFSVLVTVSRWRLIVTAKHPVMKGREVLVKSAFEAPGEVRQSRTDSQVLLFYKTEATSRWTCAVAKRVAEAALLITAYPTDAIKEAFGRQPFIFNLGHGILPDTPIAHVERLVARVRNHV